MSWTEARAALDTRLSLMPGIVWSKVALPNRDYEPTSGVAYWKVDLLPSGVDPVFSGEDHETGIYQVSRFVPAGSGIAQALTDVQALVDWFKKQNLSGVACGVPSPAPYLQEAAWLQFPVSIPFRVL